MQYVIFCLLVIQSKVSFTKAIMLLQPFLNANAQAASLTLTYTGTALASSSAIQNLTVRQVGRLALTPIIGLGIAGRYLLLGYTTGQLTANATLLLGLALTGTNLAVWGDVETNVAFGAFAATQLNAMSKALSIRNGAFGSIIDCGKQFLINTGYMQVLITKFVEEKQNLLFQRLIFNQQCQDTISHMFQEHTLKRYIMSTAQNPVTYSPLIPATISSVSLGGFVCWACVGIGITGIAVLGGLALFQRNERRRIDDNSLSFIELK